MNTSEEKIEKIAFYAEKLDSCLQNKSSKTQKREIHKELKNLLGQRGQGNLVIAQINPIAGNIEYNALKAMEYIYSAEEIGADTIVFPELTLMGYQILDTIDRHPIIVKENVKWLKAIAKRTGKTNVVIGFVEPRNGEKIGKAYYNSVAILGQGKIKGIIRKSLLPTYSEFYDYRYLEPSPVAGVQPSTTIGAFGASKISDCDKLADSHGLKYGIVICEDGWNDKDFFSNPLYSKDPVSELAQEYPDIFVNCSASPTRSKKEQLKHNMLSFVAKKYKTPFVYVNQVGAIDDCSFDGASRVYNKRGTLIARAKSFEEQFLIVNPLTSEGKIYPLTKGLEKTLKSQKVFSLDYEPDLERTYKTIVQGIKDYFNKNGLQRAVIGLSGGLDSTVSCTLLADALGAENIYGVSMPSKITSAESISDAQKLAKNLGINFTEIPIKSMVDTMNETILPVFNTIEKKWNDRYKKSFVSDNLQARSRAIILWGISNEFGATIPIATSDKSELYMGYATINGDMSGGFAPIADVPKTKLFALARWLNKNRKIKNAIPEAIILKPPGAELAINPKTGKPLVAEDALMPYEFMDEVIWRIENRHESYLDMIDDKFLYEEKFHVSKREKTEWLDKFYKRMSRALYKWSILPPSVIVEGRSINKADYRQPITSCNINYKGLNDKEIFTKLENLII